MASAYKTQESSSGTSDALLLRQKRRRFSFFILFAGILVFIAAAGALYLALRPEVLRIAVGPAGSDDQKLIQALAQRFARDKSAVRRAVISICRPMPNRWQSCARTWSCYGPLPASPAKARNTYRRPRSRVCPIS